MKDAISLGVGEPDFVTPWAIREAGIYSLERGNTHYTSNWGLAELRKEIANYLERRFSLKYEPKTDIMVTVGGSEAIDACIRALIDNGDEVLIPEPSFVCYSPCTVLAGGKPVPIVTRAEDEFRLTPEALKAAITPKTKLLILPYPNNPTGAVMTREDLEKIAAVIRDTNIIVLSDEIYSELTYGGTHVSIATLPGMFERTIVVNGFSKAYAMTGWRLGYAAGNPTIIKSMIKIHQFAIMSAPTTSQYAAIEALQSCDEDIERMKNEYNYRRRVMVDGFRKMGLECFEPRGAFYVFPSIKSTGMTSAEFCEKLLYSKKVAVIPGDAFGESGEGYIRASYCYSIKNIDIALERIAEFLKEI
ncbi:MAG: aminotransferase class I/II-fold pyridoxal phosphate-dependent enzyme [Ruminococcaceae bacterium]|nr:aminotransferase class I/II-fold pyridoxal phosphate-dependent enzyme [Oscillospiraceae bacterium]